MKNPLLCKQSANTINAPVDRLTNPLLNPFLYQADQLLKQGQFVSALKAVDAALEVDPSDSNALAFKGIVFYRMGNKREALHYHQRSLKLNPNNSDAHAGIGILKFNEGNYKAALNSLSVALNYNPHHVYAWIYKGRILAVLKQYDEALECFKQAIECDPRDSNLYTLKGCVMAKMNRHEEAIHLHNVALSKSTDSLDSLMAKGVSLSYLGKYQEALLSLREALSKTVNNEEFLFVRLYIRTNIGIVLANEAKYQQAMNSFIDCLNDLPREKTRDAIKKGNELIGQGHFGHALGYYDQILRKILRPMSNILVEPSAIFPFETDRAVMN